MRRDSFSFLLVGRRPRAPTRFRSDRVYREAWSYERSIGLLREEAGTLFDTRCVDALERVLAETGASAPIAVAV